VVTADKHSHIRVFKYPCIQIHPQHISFAGHSKAVSNVKFLGDSNIVSLGGHDQTIIQWKLNPEISEFTY
jgi:WD40 repeat protein